jgi:hypothetical protein
MLAGDVEGGLPGWAQRRLQREQDLPQVAMAQGRQVCAFVMGCSGHHHHHYHHHHYRRVVVVIIIMLDHYEHHDAAP